MSKKSFFLTVLIILVLSSIFGILYFQNSKLAPPEFVSPLGSNKSDSSKTSNTKEDSIEHASSLESTKVPRDKNEVFSLLLLGIDRRSKDEVGFRSDIMVLMTINPNQKKVVMTSVPRDLWINGSRINAIMTGGGWEAMQSAFQSVTGQKPIAFIQCDFEDLVWLVDAMGGVEIELENGFTDEEYPEDTTKTYMTVSFEKGVQKVDGKSALVLSRSRHGNNGEGSDFKRMQRQHKILKAMPEAILSSNSIFNPMNLPKFYQTVTEHLVTNLSLSDVKLLWDFYNIRKEYKIESLFIDSNYLINPPMSEYGGAWVLIAPNNNYSKIHTDIKVSAGLVSPENAQEKVPSNQTSATN